MPFTFLVDTYSQIGSSGIEAASSLSSGEEEESEKESALSPRTSSVKPHQVPPRMLLDKVVGLPPAACFFNPFAPPPPWEDDGVRSRTKTNEETPSVAVSARAARRLLLPLLLLDGGFSS